MELLERAPYLDKLAGHLQEATRRHGLLVLLGGEAGVGKSVLVQHFCRRSDNTAKVLVGMCDPLSTPKPLGPLLDIAAAMGGELERLMGKENRDEVFRGFLGTLQRASRPTVVVFEDIHWADEATLDLLRFLGRRIDTTRALLIATYRNDEVGPKHPLSIVIGDLATSGAVRRLALQPFSESAVGILAEGADVDPSELYRQTGGNPFFVTEVLASGAQGIPPTVRDAVLARASRLSPQGRAMLEAAAVIGFRIEPWLLSRVVDAKQEAVEECMAIGMLRAQGDVFVFRHELARDAIYESLSLQQRIDLHRQVLEALRAASSDDLARLAHHAEAAQDLTAVLEYAPAAARRAAELSAHREAAAQYARALRFAEALPPQDRAELLEAYAEQCDLIDHLAEAGRATREAIELRRKMGHHLQVGDNLSRLAAVLIRAGRNAEADAASREALRVLENLPPSRELAYVYTTEGFLRMLDRDSAAAVTWCERALPLAEAFADTHLLIRIYNALGTAQLMAGDDEPGVANLLKSAELAREAGHEEKAAHAYSNLGTGSGELYKFARAEKALEDSIAIATEHDLDSIRLYSTAWLALVYLYQGRWREAAETALAVAQRPGTAAISRIMALVALGRLRTRRGDPEAWVALDEALELAAQTQTLQRLAPVRAARAEAAWLEGNKEKTLQEACAAYDLALHHKHPWFTGELAYWRWKAGDSSEPPAWTAQPFALQISGDWREAACEWERLGCPYEAARALTESDDEEALKGALTAFEHLGARPAAQEVARRLREKGAKGIPRGPRPSTRTNPASLTSREVEVAALVAKGLRNAEIAAKLYLSPKTVDHHVSAILAKLAVRSRADIAREAAKLGILQDREPETPT